MFWENQKDVEIRYHQYINKDLNSRLQQMERSFQEQLIEAKSKISVLSKRLQSVDQQQESQKKELLELQDKYAEKLREKSKLQELYNALKRKYDQIARDNLSTRMISPERHITQSLSRPQSAMFSKRLSDFRQSSSFQEQPRKSPSGRSPVFMSSSSITTQRNTSPSFLHNRPARPSNQFMFNKSSAHRLLYTPARQRPRTPTH